MRCAVLICMLMFVSAANAAAPAEAPLATTQPAATQPVDVESATKISLHVKDASLEEIAAALSEKLGALEAVQVSNIGNRDLRSFNLDIDDEPLMSAVRKLEQTTGAAVQWPWTTERIAVLPRGATPLSDVARTFAGPYSSQHGPFLMVADEMNLSRSRELRKRDEDPPHRSMDLMLAMYMEPKVRMTGYSPNVHVISATDETGASLTPRAVQETSWTSRPQGMIRFHCALEPTQLRGKKIALLQLDAKVRVVTAVQVTELPLGDEQHSRQFGQFTAKISAPRANAGRFEAKIVVDHGDASDADWRKFVELLHGSRFRLMDAQGRMSTVAAQVFSGQQTRTLTVRNWPVNPKEPVTFEATKLRWEMPAQTRDLEIPFEFKDLPIP
jgi:hypothetical protein